MDLSSVNSNKAISKNKTTASGLLYSQFFVSSEFYEVKKFLPSTSFVESIFSQLIDALLESASRKREKLSDQKSIYQSVYI